MLSNNRLHRLSPQAVEIPAVDAAEKVSLSRRRSETELLPGDFSPGTSSGLQQ